MYTTMEAYIRYVATVIQAGLAAAITVWPGQTWIPVVLAVAAVLGTHVIPSVQQPAPWPGVGR